jgi:hypothetical protein
MALFNELGTAILLIGITSMAIFEAGFVIWLFYEDHKRNKKEKK